MTKPLSPTQAQILTSAAQHPKRLAEAPPNLPAAARNAVLQSMLRAGLLEEVSADDGAVLRITETGLAAVAGTGAVETDGEAAAGLQEGREGRSGSTSRPESPGAPGQPPVAPLGRISLRAAATALLVAWDAGLERPPCPPP